MKRTILLFTVILCILLPSIFLFNYIYSDKSEKTSRIIHNHLTIATWNIQIFGKSKLKKQEVMTAIKKVITQFDVIAIQEERSTESIAPIFKIMLNEYCKENAIDRSYDIVSSKREGRGIVKSISKERYMIAYNDKKLVVIKSLSYVDTQRLFSRPPYSVYFRTLDKRFDFVICNFHSTPSAIKEELPALDRVYNNLQTSIPSERDIFMVGDFNANDKQLEKLFRGKYVPVFSLGMGHRSNTIRTKLYDNVLVFNGDVEILERKVFHLDEYTLEFRKKMSDHLPVYIKIRVPEKDWD